jgi:general secretion pathway protein D/MSHA biogenesis protein MshL
MELHKWLTTACLSLIFLSLTSCGGKHQKADVKENQQQAQAQAQAQATASPAQLPTRFQSPGYSVAPEEHAGPATEESDEYQVKVGATIRSTGGPQPLWDVMKRLVNLKGMTVSWASDVDRNVLIDVDISANDNFFEAIANLLRQADYFHEVKGKTVIVRNKDTKVFQIGVPSMKGGYTTTVGGNFLTKREASSGTEGTVKITSTDNQFNIWENIDTNLKVLLGTATVGSEAAGKSAAVNAQNGAQTGGPNGLGGQDASNTVKIDINRKDTKKPKGANEKNEKSEAESASKAAGISKQTALDGAFFVIDKSIGVITVTAKPVILKNVEDYINNLKKQLYQQIAIEAKIIEVYLQDNSKIGLDWSTVLKDFAVTGTTTFGAGGQVYPSSGSFVSKVAINPVSFSVLLNALNEQGDTRVLANPKLTVLNGQPAIISVGKDIAYIKTVSKEVDSDTNQTTYTAEVDNVVQGIALGVMASVLDGKKIILHLTPITTDVEDLDGNGNIKMTSFGEDALQLGLPKVKVRQMSTMVEVENGEMLVIGGLIDSAEGKSGSFAPGVGSIPIVKYLFGVEEKTMQKRELVILLTPRII